MSDKAQLRAFVADTEHAVRVLIDGMSFETLRIVKLGQELEWLDSRVCIHNYPDGFVHQPNPSREDAGAVRQTKDLLRRYGVDSVSGLRAAIQRRLENRQEARAALAGSLLQIAKQGFSTGYGSLESCPDGRLIGAVVLKDVIWQARNQSMHYEECEWDPSEVRKSKKRSIEEKRRVFEALQAEFRRRFDPDGPERCENLAWEVVSKALVWTAYEAFEQDMLSLA